MKPLIPIKPLSEAEIAQLISGEITVKKARAIQAKISERANYIVRRICEIENIDLSWWDFANEVDNDGDPIPGYFDEEKYIEYIPYTGKTKNGEYIENCLELDSFPTRWLWEDFEQEILKQKAEKAAKNAKAEEAAKKRKQTKQQLINSALAKLTEQERKALGVKKSS